MSILGRGAWRAGIAPSYARATIIIAVVIAIVGFLLIHEPRATFFSNVTRGEIRLLSLCPPIEIGRVYRPSDVQCDNITLPYKWVLVICVIAIGVVLVLRRRD